MFVFVFLLFFLQMECFKKKPEEEILISDKIDIKIKTITRDNEAHFIILK